MTRLAWLLLVAVPALGCAPAPPAKTAEQPPPFDPLGHWKLAHTDGTIFYITLKPDGSGHSYWMNGSPGTWKFDGDRLVCSWDDGWTDIIFKEGDGFKKIAYEPGRKPEGKPTNTTKAEKVDVIPPKPDVR